MIAIADCNSFYCSCEKLFRPDLWGKPVVVLSNNDGCIVSRTDEAKKLGIDMAVPYFQCKEIMEQHKVTVFSSNYHLYGDMSWRVMETFRQVMGKEFVEVYSVDEAFIDFSQVPDNQIRSKALELKEITEQNTGIPICVGISRNKLLSKIANKLAKKNKVLTKGVMVLLEDEMIRKALMEFPIEDIWGIGRRYAAKLKGFGIDTAWQLRNLPQEWFKKNFGGVVGDRLLRQLKGEAISDMKPPLVTKKMIATTRMFGRRVTELNEIEEAIASYTARAAEKLRRQFCAAGEMSVFIMYQDMNAPKGEYVVRNSWNYELLPVPTSDTIALTKMALQLVRPLYYKGRVYKKAGVLLSRIVPDTPVQGNLFTSTITNNKKLMQAIDNINFAMEPDTLRLATAGMSKTWKMRHELRSPRFTTRIDEIYLIK